MRSLAVLALAWIFVSTAFAARAAASCIEPNLADQVARADVIGYGTVIHPAALPFFPPGAIRVIGTVPINSATLTWNAASPPKDWVAQVDHAERFHIVGVWAAISAFAFFLTAVALQMPTS